MPTRAEMLGDGAIGGEEPLGVPWRFEPLHASLPLAGRLVGVLRPIVQIPVLTMFHPWEDLSLSSSVALEFVSHDHARHVGQALEQLAEELLCGAFIAAALYQDIQHVPFLIYCPPQIVTFALDCQKYFIPLPLVTRPRTAATQLVGILLSKLAAPLTNRLIRHDHSPFQQ